MAPSFCPEADDQPNTLNATGQAVATDTPCTHALGHALDRYTYIFHDQLQRPTVTIIDVENDGNDLVTDQEGNVISGNAYDPANVFVDDMRT